MHNVTNGHMVKDCLDNIALNDGMESVILVEYCSSIQCSTLRARVRVEVGVV